MKIIISLLLFISVQAHSQNNRFTGTWSNEDCKDCNKEYIFKITLVQSNYLIYGTAEVTSNKKELNSGILDITGNVSPLGERAQIKLKGKDGTSVSAVLFEKEGKIQFDKRGGDDVVPGELILTKLYE
ncbi:hypothetical protein [Flavobacterium sp. 1355]|jgi:hypothetical protein|uniref:hypothetical protein n=1 Tax=Flavobacterium sp. 1355 TaxID=2806571 RepID=UPI001AE4A944|nr:hypothetical protein [Flavobacterium sp. 1355]MBP1224505.1 hypothetical protein [Flavobacterium sp. 1355]